MTIHAHDLTVPLESLRASLLTKPEDWIEGGACVALYARISEDDGAALGVRGQLLDQAQRARMRGANIVAVLLDNDISALTGKPRPGYQDLLRLVASGAISAVIVVHTSRLIRNRQERVDVINLFMKHRAQIWVLDGMDLDMSSAMGRGMMAIMGEFDTIESEIKSERVLNNIRHRAHNGQPSTYLGFGWDVEGRGRDRRYSINEPQAEIVREITGRLLMNESLKAVTQDLNNRRVPAPIAETWGASSVRKIAVRPSNAALRLHHRGRPDQHMFPGSWPALVDREKWEKVTALLTNPKRTTTGTTLRPGARKHLLTYGIGACGVCGGPLRVGTRGSATNGVRKASYLCNAKEHVGRNQQSVDDYIAGLLVRLAAKPGFIDALLPDGHAAQAAEVRSSTLQKRLNEAIDGFSNGDLDYAEMKRIRDNLVPAIAQAEKEWGQHMKAMNMEHVTQLAKPDGLQRWEALSVSQKRTVLDALQITVVINKSSQRGPSTGARFDPSAIEVYKAGKLIKPAPRPLSG